MEFLSKGVFISCLAASRPTLGHWWRDSLSHLLLNTGLYQGQQQPCNRINFQNLVERISVIEQRTVQFWDWCAIPQCHYLFQLKSENYVKGRDGGGGQKFCRCLRLLTPTPNSEYLLWFPKCTYNHISLAHDDFFSEQMLLTITQVNDLSYQGLHNIYWVLKGMKYMKNGQFY